MQAVQGVYVPTVQLHRRWKKISVCHVQCNNRGWLLNGVEVLNISVYCKQMSISCCHVKKSHFFFNNVILVYSQTPHNYFEHIDHMNQRQDKYRRPELCRASYEFVATKDYCRVSATFNHFSSRCWSSMNFCILDIYCFSNSCI